MNDNVAVETVDSEADNILQKQNFGSGLKQARESSGISMQDIADRLLISVDIIKAIENSQSENLPAATFTQGYIRSYSKILGVDAEPVIEDYLNSVPDNKKISTPHAILPEPAQGDAAFIKNLLQLLFVAAILYGFYWLYDNLSTNQLSSGLKPIFNETSTVSHTQSSQEEPFQYEQTESIGFNSETIEVNTTLAEVQDELHNEPEYRELSSIDSTTAVDPAEQASISTDQIYLHAGESSWCEILDRHDNRLVYRLLKAGETLTLSGEAPFRVFLGNAPSITLHINEKEVAFSHLIGSYSNTANMKLHADASIERFRRP